VRPADHRPVSGLDLLLVAVAAVAGGAVQSALGFGAAFTTVPVLAVVAPELLPGAALLAFLPLTLLMAVRERSHLDRPTALRIMAARVPGILLGTAAVRVADPDALAVGVAVVLILAVLTAATGWRVPATPRNEVGFGMASGLAGTAVGLGGPPLAVLFRERPPAEIRATMSAVFAVGIVMSLLSLGVTGSFDGPQAVVGGQLALAILAGLLVATPLVRRLSDAHLRRGLLVWAGGGSAAALLRVLAG
jgi:uncharacterized membrane protein YfcA